MYRIVPIAAALAAIALSTACDNGTDPGDIAASRRRLDSDVCRPSAGGFSANITNPYFPLPPGSRMLLEGEEDGIPISLTITVFEATRVVAGVPTREVEERHVEGGELLEVSRNFFVQAADGSVCYFGEEVDMYENGVIVGHDGAWLAGVDGALPGILMPAAPAIGMSFHQEVAPDIAEDRVVITAMGKTVTVPFGTFSNTVRFREFTRLEPGAVSIKNFAYGVGMITDDALQLVSRTP